MGTCDGNTSSETERNVGIYEGLGVEVLNTTGGPRIIINGPYVPLGLLGKSEG